jgi:hypothetical protein
MRKFIFSLFLILALAVMVIPAFAAVGVQTDGTQDGTATDINVAGGGGNSSLDGSVYTIDLSKPANITSTGTIKGKRVASSVSTLSGGVHNLTLNCSLGDVFTYTPSTNASIGVSNIVSGQNVSIIITTSGASTYQLSFNQTNGNFKTAGYLNTGTTSGAVFVIDFVSDGTKLYETGRTSAM